MKNLLFAILLLSFSSVFSQKADTIIGNGSNKKVQILYFHITNRCSTCRNIEAKVLKTIDSLYANEIKAGTLVFSSYNCEIPENAAIAKKYDAYGATLAFTTFSDGKEVKTEDLTNWAFEKIHKTDVFIKELSQKLSTLLK